LLKINFKHQFYFWESKRKSYKKAKATNFMSKYFKGENPVKVFAFYVFKKKENSSCQLQEIFAVVFQYL